MGESEFREKVLALLERLVKAMEPQPTSITRTADVVPENGSGGWVVGGRKS